MISFLLEIIGVAAQVCDSVTIRNDIQDLKADVEKIKREMDNPASSANSYDEYDDLQRMREFYIGGGF